MSKSEKSKIKHPETFVEYRMRDSLSGEAPDWFNNLVGKSIPYRLRWAVQRIQGFKSASNHAKLQVRSEQQAYANAPEDAFKFGMVIDVETDWLSDRDGKNMKVFRVKKTDGTVITVTSPICKSEEYLRKTTNDFNLLVSLITDTVRDAKLLYPGLIDADSVLDRVCDNANRLGQPDVVPERITPKLLKIDQLSDGRCFLRFGDSAVIWYWVVVESAIIQLAINVEQNNPSEQTKQIATQGNRDRGEANPAMGLVSVSDLAECHKLTELQTDALRKRLERWRPSHCNGEWIEVDPSYRRTKDPKYLYDPTSVISIINKIKN